MSALSRITTTEYCTHKLRLLACVEQVPDSPALRHLGADFIDINQLEKAISNIVVDGIGILDCQAFILLPI